MIQFRGELCRAAVSWPICADVLARSEGFNDISEIAAIHPMRAGRPG